MAISGDAEAAEAVVDGAPVQAPRLQLLVDAERSRLALEAGAVGTWDLDVVTGLVHCSDHCRRILGLRDDAPLERERFASLIHPEDLPRVQEANRRALAGRDGGAAAYEMRITRADDGERRWIASRGRALFDPQGAPLRLVGTTIDITARKQEEVRNRCLAQSGAIFNATLDPDAILKSLARLTVPLIADWCAVDRVDDGQLRRLCVEHPDPVRIALAHELHRRYPPRDGDLSLAVLQSARAALVARVDDTLLRQRARDDEHYRIVRELGLRSCMVVPLCARGRVLALLTLATAESGRSFTAGDLSFAEDLAQRAAMALDNGLLYQEAEQARRELARKATLLARSNAELEQFAYIASHDLQEPLRMIANWLQVLQRRRIGRDDPFERSCFAYVQDNAVRMHAMVDGILEYCLAGTVDSAPPFVDLGDAVCEAWDALPRSDGEDAPRLILRELPAVRMDRTRLLQLLGHLLANAVKFRSARPVEVTVRARVVGRELHVAIQDNGIGIPVEDRRRLFVIFRRLHPAGNYPGIGIGLATCKKIVEVHGGRIWVEDAPGGGTTVVFTIPKALVRDMP